MLLKSREEGYVMIDHRASPGIPSHIARLMGVDPKLTCEGKVFEAASLTCAHCKVAVIKSPLRTRERGSCAKCGHHYICDICAYKASLPDYNHAPFEQKIEQQLRRPEQPQGSPSPLFYLPNTPDGKDLSYG